MKTTVSSPDGLKPELRTQSFRLRLWLPGYHTPSGNDTIGKHWSKVYKMKKAAGGHLLAALADNQTGRQSDGETVREGKRVLAKIALGVRLETRRGKKPVKLRRVEARLRWTMFKLGVWPPVNWMVPETLAGAALMQMLEERHAAFYKNTGKRGARLAESRPAEAGTTIRGD
jgi:hypothetical protein